LFAKAAKRHLSLKILIYCYGVSSEKDESKKANLYIFSIIYFT